MSIVNFKDIKVDYDGYCFKWIFNFKGNLYFNRIGEENNALNLNDRKIINEIINMANTMKRLIKR